MQHLTTPTIEFDVTNQTYFEFDGLQKAYFSLSNELDDTVRVTVDIDVTSSATLNSDYTLSTISPKTFTFSPGETKDSVEFLLVDNPDVESLETLIFNITSTINGEIGANSSDTIFIQDNEVLSLTERDNNSFKIFPNPANPGQVITFDKSYSYQVLDVSGKVVLVGNAKQFSTTILSSGAYLVQYGTKTEKLIIN